MENNSKFFDFDVAFGHVMATAFLALVVLSAWKAFVG